MRGFETREFTILTDSHSLSAPCSYSLKNPQRTKPETRQKNQPQITESQEIRKEKIEILWLDKIKVKCLRDSLLRLPTVGQFLGLGIMTEGEEHLDQL